MVKKNVVMFTFIMLGALYFLYPDLKKLFCEEPSENHALTSHNNGSELRASQYERTVQTRKSVNLNNTNPHRSRKKMRALKRHKRETFHKIQPFAWNVTLDARRLGNDILKSKHSALDRKNHLHIKLLAEGNGFDESRNEMHQARTSIDNLLKKMFGGNVDELKQEGIFVNINSAGDFERKRPERNRQVKFLPAFFNFGNNKESPEIGNKENFTNDVETSIHETPSGIEVTERMSETVANLDIPATSQSITESGKDVNHENSEFAETNINEEIVTTWKPSSPVNKRIFGGILTVGSGERELFETTTNLDSEDGRFLGFVNFGSGERELVETDTISEEIDSLNNIPIEPIIDFSNDARRDSVNIQNEFPDSEKVPEAGVIYMNSRNDFSDKESFLTNHPDFHPNELSIREAHIPSDKILKGKNDHGRIFGFPNFGSGDGRNLGEIQDSVDASCKDCLVDSMKKELFGQTAQEMTKLGEAVQATSTSILVRGRDSRRDDNSSRSWLMENSQMTTGNPKSTVLTFNSTTDHLHIASSVPSFSKSPTATEQVQKSAGVITPLIAEVNGTMAEGTESVVTGNWESMNTTMISVITESGRTPRVAIEPKSQKFCHSASQCNTELNERCNTVNGRGVCNCGRSYVRHPDTKKCEVPVTLKTSLKLPEEAFHQDLNDKNTPLYRKKRQESVEMVWLLLHNDPKLTSQITDVDVVSFEEGSLVINLELVLAADGNESIDDLIYQVDKDLKEAFTDSNLLRRSPLKAHNAILLTVSSDIDPCQKTELNYCSLYAKCTRHLKKGFECRCNEGFLDISTDVEHAGEICIEICLVEYCGENGYCELMADGKRRCVCKDWYFGSRCEFPGIVVIASFTVANLLMILVVVIIVCICRKRRHRRTRFYSENQINFQPEEQYNGFAGNLYPRLSDTLALGEYGSKTSKLLKNTPKGKLADVGSSSFNASCSVSSSNYDSTFDRTPLSPRDVTSIGSKSRG